MHPVPFDAPQNDVTEPAVLLRKEVERPHPLTGVARSWIALFGLVLVFGRDVAERGSESIAEMGPFMWIILGLVLAGPPEAHDDQSADADAAPQPQGEAAAEASSDQAPRQRRRRTAAADADAPAAPRRAPRKRSDAVAETPATGD